ncbi:hypothetical protein [Achromobacter phage Motura]|uniref:Uncharacterized protein n=1 Tax=Achromobacter phage Motura TaxID=2591403 RepID=A0A514CT74_9CAUD|nr:tail sheath [Achromobacter phage Motura]QDH83673.1 hypothetical protein [Achromobacter phage Motura]
MAQDYSWSKYTPVDNTGNNRSIFKSAYKNVRFALVPNRRITLDESQAANLPGLSHAEYGVWDFWEILLAYNGLQDPIQDVVAGMPFLLPTKASIISYLTRQQATNTTTLTI